MENGELRMENGEWRIENGLKPVLGASGCSEAVIWTGLY